VTVLETLTFGPWIIHPKRLTATKGDTDIQLTVRGMKIVILLARRRGELFTRDELLNECRGLEFFPGSRTLDQHILSLRKKIEDDRSSPPARPRPPRPFPNEPPVSRDRSRSSAPPDAERRISGICRRRGTV
jgi:hypothetical protein